MATEPAQGRAKPTTTDATHATHATDAIMVARDVHKWFGELHVLKGIDLTVQTGEVSSSSARPARVSQRSCARSTAWSSTSAARSSWMASS